MPPPENSPLKQQTLRAWRPILTPRLVIMLFANCGIIFVPIGAAIVGFSNQVVEVSSVDYAASCCVSNCDSLIPWERVDSNPCTSTITVERAMEPPIYMYYQLTNYYQNHRRYVRSRDDNQLKGRNSTLEDLAKFCEYHYETDAGQQISPCGLVAWSVFNDSFALSKADGQAVPLQETGIAWPTDLYKNAPAGSNNYKFKNQESGTTGLNFPPFAHWRASSCSDLPTASQRLACTEFNEQHPGAGWCYPNSTYCVEDEHFVVWMRAAGLPSFRKLYAIIDTRLEPGTYTVQVSNGLLESGQYMNKWTGASQSFLYPVSSFGGTKQVVLSTTSWLGGQNFFLGYAYIIVGVVCIMLALSFCLKYNMGPRDLGDAAYITWQKDATAPPY